MSLRDRGIEIKTPEQIGLMRVAGRLVGETLELLRSSVRAGITTGELDAIAEDNIRSHGGIPSFQGYGHPPFPASICASVNDEVVHGIPGSTASSSTATSSPSTAARSSTAGTVTRRITVAVGDVRPEVLELMRVTEESMWRGFAAARLGGRVSDISHAVEAYVRSQPAAELRHPRGLHRPRHRHRDAPAAERAELRPPGPRAQAGARAWRWPSSRW